MSNVITLRKPYPSDLTAEQWAVLEREIPPARQRQKGGRSRTATMREIVNAILYLNRSGCQWDMLPHDLPAKSTVYECFSQWRDDGTGTKILTTLRTQSWRCSSLARLVTMAPARRSCWPKSLRQNFRVSR